METITISDTVVEAGAAVKLPFKVYEVYGAHVKGHKRRALPPPHLH